MNIAKAVQSSVGVTELCRLYIELVREIPEVQLVVVSQEGDTVYITTVIEAPPFQRQIRDRIYLFYSAFNMALIHGKLNR